MSVKEREAAMVAMIRERDSPKKPEPPKESEKVVELNLHPNQEEEDVEVKPPKREEIEETLALNQRLMDVAENTNLLLNQYAMNGEL
jgi:hypothetical protein